MVKTTRRWICDICQADFKGGDMQYATEEDYNNLRPEGVCAFDLTYPIKDVDTSFEANYSHDRKYITRYKTLSLDMCDKCARMFFDNVLKVAIRNMLPMVNAIRMSEKCTNDEIKTDINRQLDAIPRELEAMAKAARETDAASSVDPDEYTNINPEDLVVTKEEIEQRFPEVKREPNYSYGICNDSKVISNNKTSKSMLESIKLRHPFGNENI